MKICIVTTAFPRWKGDSWGSFIFEATRALQHHGLEVRVIAMHCPGSYTREYWDGLEIIRTRYLPERWEILRKDSGGLPEFWKTSSWARLVIIPFLLFHTINCAYYCRDVDIIHANWTLSGAAAWLSQCVHRRPYVVTVHGSDIYQALKIPLVKFISRWLLTKASYVVAVSDALKNEVINLGVVNKDIFTIPDGVDIHSFPMSIYTRDPNVLYVGSFIQRKGLKILINAFQIAKKIKPEIKLILIGDGPQKTELIEFARYLGVIDEIRFLGYLTQEEVSIWMQKSKLFVLPSTEEGLGVVLLEALACGTPCIGSDVGGIPDVITPEVGVLFPPGDFNALADQIILLFNEIELWNKYSRTARERAVNYYGWDSIAKKLKNIYLNTLKLQDRK